MIKYNENNINDWYFADDNIVKVYRNEDVIYQKIASGSTPPSPSGLPSGYTEVEYVENTGTTYINTSFKPNQDTRIVAEMQTVTSTSGGRFIGAGGFDGANAIQFDYETGALGTLHISWGGKAGWTNYSSCLGDYAKHTYDWDKNYFYRDKGTSSQFSASTSYTSYQCTDDLGIFTRYQNGAGGGSNECLKGKMYSFKIYDNGTLVRDLIPCTRDSDNKVGAYDIVNDVFYVPNNGNLVAGPIV